jgi:hypothetical protein
MHVTLCCWLLVCNQNGPTLKCMRCNDDSHPTDWDETQNFFITHARMMHGSSRSVQIMLAVYESDTAYQRWPRMAVWCVTVSLKHHSRTWRSFLGT